MAREMEDAVFEAKRAAARAAADLRRLEGLRDRQIALASEWERRAGLALRNDRGELARAAVRRELHLRRTAAELAPDVYALDQRCGQMQADVQTLQARLEEARLRARRISSRQGAAEAQRQVQEAYRTVVTGPAVAEFERLEIRIEDMEIEVAAWQGAQSDSLEARFLELETDDAEVDARIAELRASEPDAGRPHEACDEGDGQTSPERQDRSTPAHDPLT